MLEKIRKYLNKEHLGWVILDSIPQARLVSFMSRLGIEYPGVRITSLPHQELAYDLAEEAFSHKEVMDALMRVLDELNSKEVQSLSHLSFDEVKDLIADPNKVYLPKGIGKIIWALLSDPRQVVNELTPQFIETVEKAIKMEKLVARQMDKQSKRIDTILSSKRGVKKILKSLSLLEAEITEEKRFSVDLRRENQRLKEKTTEQHNLIHQLRKSNAEWLKEKSAGEKRIERQETEIQNLLLSLKELKNQLAVGSKMRLKAEIHRLEKENSKANYILDKERQESNAKVIALEKELLQLKENLNELQQINSQLQQQLDGQKQESDELQKRLQLLSGKKEPLPPKEQGKRLGIFIDNQNVYYSTKMHYGRKLDYRKLLEVLVKDRHLVKAICYVVKQPEVSQEGFINMLKNNGYTVRVRELIRRADGSAKGNWDIGIAADVITMVEKNNLDIVVLVTCDGDFVDLVKLLSAKGIRVEVIGFPMNMAMDLKKTADDFYFITEDLMIGT